MNNENNLLGNKKDIIKCLQSIKSGYGLKESYEYMNKIEVKNNIIFKISIK